MSSRSKKTKKRTRESPTKREEINLDWVDVLPITALQELLLNLPANQLNYICNSNRRAYSICSLSRFRELYTEKHSRENNMFFGNVTYLGRDLKYNPKYGKIFLFEDDRKTKLNVTLGVGGLISNIDYIPFQNGDAMSSIMLNLKRTAATSPQKRSPSGVPKGYAWIGTLVRKDNSNLSRADIDKFLDDINKPKWMPKNKMSNRITAVATNDAIKRIENEIGKHMKQLFFLPTTTTDIF